MEKCKRVRYKNSPLLEVIFQLRFPTILTINANPPVEFQEKIRNEFPYYNEVIEQQDELVMNPVGMPPSFKRNETKNYSFVSADSQWKINLTSSFIALSTTSYTQWEHFFEKLQIVISVFEEVYRPPFYTRIGLRYIDAITKSKWGLSERKWSELLKPHIAGIMTPDIEDGIESYMVVAEHKALNDVITKTHLELVHINNSPETSLLIDCDYFLLKTTQKELLNEIANMLHDNSCNFIGKSVTELLSDAMEPEDI